MPRAGGNLDGRVVLVAGASRGLGRAVAKAAAIGGAKVVALARTRAGLTELDDAARAEGAESLTLLPLDLADGDAVDRVGPTLYHRFGRLDAIVYAAAEPGPATPTWQLDPKALARTIEVGALAAQRLIRSVDPVLRAGEGGDAVFFKDADAPLGQGYIAAYTAAKAALEAIVGSYAAETAKFGVRVHLLDPGPMHTGLWRTRYPGRRHDPPPGPDAAAGGVVGLLRGGQKD